MLELLTVIIGFISAILGGITISHLNLPKNHRKKIRLYRYSVIFFVIGFTCLFGSFLFVYEKYIELLSKEASMALEFRKINGYSFHYKIITNNNELDKKINKTTAHNFLKSRNNEKSK